MKYLMFLIAAMLVALFYRTIQVNRAIANLESMMIQTNITLVNTLDIVHQINCKLNVPPIRVK